MSQDSPRETLEIHIEHLRLESEQPISEHVFAVELERRLKQGDSWGGAVPRSVDQVAVEWSGDGPLANRAANAIEGVMKR